MLDLGALRMSIVTDTSGAKQELNSLKDTVYKTGESMTRMGGNLTKALTLPIIGIGAAAVKTASDVSESMNKMNAVYGDNAKMVEDWSNTSSSAYGMSKSQFLDYVGTYGALSQDLLKMNEADSAEFSKQIIQRSADISSYYNLTMDESNSLMQQLYSGETEGWKKLGITINDTTMQEFALSKGINKTIKDMSLQEKTALRVEMAMEKTNRAEGDFANTKDGLANSSRILQAQLSDLAATIGAALLPTVTSIVGKVNEVLTAMIAWSKENPALLDIIIKIAGALALLGPTLLAVGTAMKMATTIGPALTAAFNPVGLVIMAVAGAIALLAFAWKENIGGIQEKTKAAFDMIKATFEDVFPTLELLFYHLINAFKAVWETIGVPLFNAFGEIIKVIASLFSTLFPLIVKVVGVTFSAILLAWKTVLKPVFDAFVSIVSGLYNLLKKPLDDVMNAFTVCFDWIVDKVQAAIDLVSFLIEKAKEVAEFFSGDGGSSTPASPRTQFHADGGILTKATVFGFGSDGTRHVGGEAGAEAIIPLSKLPEILSNMGMAGGGVVVNNYSPKALSVSETARLYKQSQRELALNL